MRKLLFVFTIMIVVLASCKSQKRNIGVTGADEPTYKKDRRLNEARTPTNADGAVGVGTGGSYGGTSSRSQAMKADKKKSKEKSKEKRSVRPE